MRLTACRVVSLSVVLVLAVVFFIVLLLVPQLVWKIAQGKIPITKGSDSAEHYKQLPVNITQNVYVFNITNYDAFMNHGATPDVEELGPYTFTSVWLKNMSWSDGRLLFRESRTFYFDAERSNGTLDDEVYVVDIVYLNIVKYYDELPWLVKVLVKRLMKLRTVLAKHKVREMLYEGYPDEIAKIISMFKPDLPIIDGKVGFLLGQNGTDEGQIEVFDGSSGTLSQLNDIITFRNSSTIPWYDAPCNNLSGTNGELFPPFPDEVPPSISFFSSMFCRPWQLQANGTETIAEVESAVFRGAADLFSPTGDPVLDRCYEPNGLGYQGVFDASKCQKDQPIALSLPHFLHANESLLKNVTGLNPDPSKHGFSLSVFRFGVVTNLNIRVQINCPLRAHPEEDGENIIFPLFWQELVVNDEDRVTLNKFVYDQAIKPQKLLQGVTGGMGAALVVLLAVLAATFFILDRRQSVSSNKDEERAVITHHEVPQDGRSAD